MKRLSLFALLICSILCLSVSSAFGQGKRRPDKVKETKTIQGSFVSFESGDYLHATIKKSNGEETSFFLMKHGLEYFLVLHKGEPLTLTYQIVDTYIPEAGGMETIERLISAKHGDLTYEAWWTAAKAKSTEAQLQKKYDPLVQKATIEP